MASPFRIACLSITLSSRAHNYSLEKSGRIPTPSNFPTRPLKSRRLRAGLHSSVPLLSPLHVPFSITFGGLTPRLCPKAQNKHSLPPLSLSPDPSFISVAFVQQSTLIGRSCRSTLDRRVSRGRCLVNRTPPSLSTDRPLCVVVTCTSRQRPAHPTGRMRRSRCAHSPGAPPRVTARGFSL